MNNFFKSIIAVSVTASLTISTSNAATYKIIDEGAMSSLEQSYSQKSNSHGERAQSGGELYNFPVQFQYLDDEDFDRIRLLSETRNFSEPELVPIEDFEALKAGNPTANDLSWTVIYLKERTSSLYQKVGDIIALGDYGFGPTEITVFDELFEGTDTLTRSTIDYTNGINDLGWIYGNGSAPYLPIPFVNSNDEEQTFFAREFGTRAFITFDQGQSIKPILPPLSEYGGESGILGMNHLTAVGFASHKFNENRIDDVLDETGGCADPDVLDDLPLEVCIQNLRGGLYHIVAYQWMFDESGNVVEEEPLGYLVEQHEDDDRVFASYAQAVNSLGVAVGFANGWYDKEETDPSRNETTFEYPVMYKGGEVISLSHDHKDNRIGRTYDINDRGIAVGHIFTNEVTDTFIRKFFYVDTNLPESERKLIFPDDFFNSSVSTARAINENNFVVGEGQIESHLENQARPRRTHGFLYDIENDVFSNLNSLVGCNSEYTIFEARDINDLNEIAASAVITVPRKDSKGELLYDENGDQLFEDVVRAVTLVPIEGEVEDCSKVEEKVKRKGASFGYGLIALLALFGFNRRLIAK